MSTYSVAEAQDRLAGLIDRVIAGDQVIIAREGKPVAELRPTAAPAAAIGSHEWFLSRRVKPAPGSPTSVELLNMIYEQPPL